LPDSNTSLAPTQPTVPTFEIFATQRRLLQEFCELHVASVEYFRSGLVYKRDADDGSSTKLRHITSTATCYGSLELCPDRFLPDGSRPFAKAARAFARKAITLRDERWVSDESANIYCRCRGLPFVVSQLEKWDKRIGDHLNTIFSQIKNDPSRLAIGEANPSKPKDDWYPPNGYHTYWTLELLDALDDEKFRPAVRSLGLPSSDTMIEWAKQALGYQVSLHSADSSDLDSDQLGWSLAIFIRDPKAYQSKLAAQDFIRKAFQCLFSTQTKVGTWRHYAPLFHYKATGNAYCYVFETFAGILRQALKPQATFVRTVLKSHFYGLIKLWEYAKSTQSLLGGDTRKLGWSSGHRGNKPNPESWATASVFEYAQCLRRLVGIWAREEALATLNYKRTYFSTAEAEDKLLERSRTWTRPNLADSLLSMFINHVADKRAEDVRLQERLEPDQEPIGEKFLRSAILFGPPGTSKTTLVKAVAGSVGWDYVELHASHFVAGGLTDVQRTADLIFRKLMELDHAVVLFDEIDELVRERDVEPDAFGRFLTTSMLPKLAELWEARKIKYFVATNHIEYFDRAVTRSQRFDAIIFMSPPSFAAKKNRLIKILKETYNVRRTIAFSVQKKDIDNAKPTIACNPISQEADKGKRDILESGKIPDDNALFKFALLRYDELGELASHLESQLKGKSLVTKEMLKASLLEIKDGRWRNLGEYDQYLSDPAYERRDFTKCSAWVVTNPTAISGRRPDAIQERRDGATILVAPVSDSKDLTLPGYIIESAGPGKVRLIKT
jgi:hypothetical protein